MNGAAARSRRAWALVWGGHVVLVEDDADLVVRGRQQHFAVKVDDLALLGRAQRAHERLKDVGHAIVCVRARARMRA